jgi:2-dehydropantoate 2-reductase
MSNEKPERYIIFGAGAIGTAVGGLLIKAGKAVEFIARPQYAEAIQRGVTIKQDGNEIHFQANAVTSAGQLEYKAGDVVFIAVKSQVMADDVEELAAVCDRSIPVVCLQNGTRNEEIAGQRFDRVYAALVLMSAVQLEPEIVTMPRGRSIAVGLYPQGVDELSRRMAADLTEAGFDALASAYVMAMKWGKLIANLNNATHTICGYWLERGLADLEMRRLVIAVREEGMQVLDAAGIVYEPPADEPSPLRIVEWTNRIRQTQKNDPEAANLPEASRTQASMYQDLVLGRRSHEAEFLNGEIVALGKQVGLPTPYNSTLLEVVDRMFAEGMQPGLYTPAELHALIEERKASNKK